MTKVRIGHEDVFIGKTYQDPIPKNFIFIITLDGYLILVNKTNSNKKNKSISLTFPFKALILYNNDIHNPQNMMNYDITCSLSDRNAIINLLDYFCKEVNEQVARYHPNASFSMSYTYHQETVVFDSVCPVALGFSFYLFDSDSLRICNVLPINLNPYISPQYFLSSAT
jgi:hypothetical protein